MKRYITAQRSSATLDAVLVAYHNTEYKDGKALMEVEEAIRKGIV